MKASGKPALITLLWLFSLSPAYAELLGKISDETAKLPVEEPKSTTKQNKISYRVICQPDDEEKLPDCDQPPIEDIVETTQIKPPEPEKAAAPAPMEQEPKKAYTENQQEAIPQSHKTKKAAHKKLGKHKKHLKHKL
jgi:hypothetical protein